MQLARLGRPAGLSRARSLPWLAWIAVPFSLVEACWHVTTSRGHGWRTRHFFVQGREERASGAAPDSHSRNKKLRIGSNLHSIEQTRVIAELYARMRGYTLIEMFGPTQIRIPGVMSLLCLLLFTCLATARSSSKRGLIYVYPSHQDENYALFSSPKTGLSWYYNYSPSPSLSTDSRLSFVPMIYDAIDFNSSVASVQALPNVTHLLTFNEPDNSVQAALSPKSAAEMYLNSILPLRSAPYNLKISLPATTGSGRGLRWLSDFNQSCYQLAPDQGCVADFLAAHSYFDFEGMASWLETLHTAYPALPIWLTEFALPKEDLQTTLHFLNQSLAHLDQLEYVHRYAWYGAFRTWDGNAYTGPNVAIIDNGGRLTELGARYLGDEAAGVYAGEKVASEGARVDQKNVWMLAGMACVLSYLLQQG